MKKFLLLPFVLVMTVLTAEANVGVKVFDVPVEKGALKEVVNKQQVKHEETTQTVQQPKDIVVENINGIYFIKITPALLKGELKPYYVWHLTTNRDVYDQTGARLVVNSGFFDPRNEQTVSYLTLNGKVVLNPQINKNLMGNKHLQPYMDKILNRSEFRVLKSTANGKLKYDIAPHNAKAPEGYEVLHAMQGGPALLPKLRLDEEFFVLTDKSGKIISQSASSLSKYARTLIAIKGEDIYFVIATTEHPVSLPEAAEILKKAGMEKAMAFDGGGSVSVDFRDKNLHIISDKDQTARKLKSFMIVTDANQSRQLEEANQTLQRPKPKVEEEDENAIKLDLTNTEVKQEVKSEQPEIKTSPNAKKQDLKIKQEK